MPMMLRLDKMLELMQMLTFASVNTTGNIVAQGDITAQNYIVSSSVTHMTSSQLVVQVYLEIHKTIHTNLQVHYL